MEASLAAASLCEEALTTVRMIDCAASDLKTAEQELDYFISSLTQSSDETRREILTASQEAWQGYRNTQCLLDRDQARGGTMASLLEISCRTSLTEARVAALRQFNEVEPPADETLIWAPSASFSLPMMCDAPVTAQLGFMPIYRPDLQRTELYARVHTDGHDIDIQIGSGTEEALCGPILTLSRSSMPSECPALRLDDGLCDAFHIYWDKPAGRYKWRRLN